jgi:ABC-2 type transport system ATP-binding protein
MLSIRELHKSYYHLPVLRGVSLNLRPGSVHGLVGANGAGKTTLIHCLYGLVSDYQGEVRETTGLIIRECTGLLPYEPYFYPRLTGREYVTFCLQARRQPVAGIDAWNELLELPLEQYAETYSAGMKKKLALLALLVQPLRYLVLDEPFNGLDLSANLLLQQVLRRLRDQGTGILLTSHILTSLTEVCDEITVLAEGQVQRHYTGQQFGELTGDLLSAMHQDKLRRLAELLPVKPLEV